MKVFLSWSGNLSLEIAKVFRDWFPSVIQSIVPYVSSEDIDKGARWSTDIANELQDSSYGILCITKENINAPWVNFEAGALSKTIDKSYVSPFLYDIKRSEVDGPILQFQSTIYEKEDIKKLVKSMNKACGEDCLTEERLEKAFEVWYPSLENNLNGLSEKFTVNGVFGKKVTKDQAILEEILDLSRNNQRLLRNPDGQLAALLEDIRMNVMKFSESINYMEDLKFVYNGKKYDRKFIEEFLITSKRTLEPQIFIRICLSLLRDQFPWVNDLGIETLKILESNRAKTTKSDTVHEFLNILDFSLKGPLSRKFILENKEFQIIYYELSKSLNQLLEQKISK